jgi:type IV secretory pathway VirB2 component (pilin)
MQRETAKSEIRWRPHRNSKEVKRIMYNKIIAMLIVAMAAVSGFAQDAALSLPADTETKLTGLISGSFPTVIAVVVVIVGAGLLIKFIKRV